MIGFLEASLRAYADGCDSSPVGYIEGWYVLPEHRRRNVGRSLVQAAEDWARTRGCSEMASDVLLQNTISQQAHIRLGYEEVDRVVQYRKGL
jgi:aminoglycoside 6'-N-acetyltransferase I